MVQKKKKRASNKTRLGSTQTKPRRRPQSRAETQSPGDAPKSGFRLNNEELERAITSGDYRGMLVDYFGQAEYETLVELARQASSHSTRGGPRVLIVPGIMGSKLGRQRALFDDVIWIDPVDILSGKLSRLALPDNGDNQPMGVLLFAYLKLKLRLRLSGFDAIFHAFDWRKSITELGARLAKEVVASSASQVHLVAHSMGGLVSRAALNDMNAAAKIGKLVMLGTPNFGSFAPIEALRGTYSVVSALAKSDLRASPLGLAKEVFSTFPGLHQMAPSARLFKEVDLFNDPAFWKGTGGNLKILETVPAFQDSLSPARPGSTFLIAGVNQETTVGLRMDDHGVVYERNRAGDGTVPLKFAELPGATTYYVEESHGSLPNNGVVEDAVVDLLRHGKTNRLPTSWDRTRVSSSSISEEELRHQLAADRRSPTELGFEDHRNVLSPFVSAGASAFAAPLPVGIDSSTSAAIPPGYQHEFADVVVSRRRQHSIEIELAQGSITAANSRALVLGFFQGVDPSGPAGAVDEALDGAILEMVERRMFSADAGHVFVLPAGRSSLYADSVLFAGLGGVETFKPSVQEFVAENVVRTFVRSHVEEFATVLTGASAGMSVEASLQHQLRGYIRGLLESDDDHRLRRITLCEVDRARYAIIKQELHRLTSTTLFEDVRVTLTERRLPPPVIPEGSRRPHVSSTDNRVYLIVNYEEREDVQVNETSGMPDITNEQNPVRFVRSALLTAGGKATVFRESTRFEQAELDELLGRLMPENVSAENVERVGVELGPLLLGERIVKALERVIDDHQLVIVHDAAAGRIPWETLRVNGSTPAVQQGLSRRYAADNLSITKWLEERRRGETLEILLVVNPTEDLDGAEREGAMLEHALTGNDGIRVTKIARGEATREHLLREFSSGKYDALHYAGHAFFDPFQPSKSGVLCAGHQVLSGAHLAELTHLPALVFFNACESGRVRQAQAQRKKAAKKTRQKAPPAERSGERLTHSVGLAEAFLRGGVANYLGTYWPVGDASAEKFATTLYAALLHGQSISEALRAGRRALVQAGSYDWADYIHYGSQDFVLKHRDAEI
jgi:CHAT domain-containing protein/pimeloyl-ACP methyl ester carboxylesterase